jgi:hypothetical protein
MRESQVVRKHPLTIFAFEHDTWPAVALLDDPTISRRVRHRIRPRLTALLGQERMQYLESLSEAPEAELAISDVTTRLTESRVLNEERVFAALVDRMVLEGDNAASARAVLCELDCIISHMKSGELKASVRLS